MNILLTVRNPEVKDYINFSLSPYHVSTHHAENYKQAFQKLQKNKDHFKGAIFDNIGKQFDQKSTQNILHKYFPELPIIFITHHRNENHNNISYITAPFQFNEIPDSLGLTSKLFNHSPAYYAVNSLELLNQHEFRADLFFETKNGSYIPLVRNFEPQYLEKLKVLKNQDRPIFLKKKDYCHLLDHISKKILSYLNKESKENGKSKASETNTSISIERSFDGAKFIIEATRVLEINKTVIKVVTSTKDHIINNIIKKDTKLFSVVSKILSINDRLSARCLLIPILSGQLLKCTDFNYRVSLEKIVLASLLHDIELRDLRDKDISLLNGLEKKIYYNHPLMAVERIKSNRHIPEDVITIIREHHELPNSDGFPHKKSWKGLHALSRHFIVCECVAELIFDYGPTPYNLHQIKNELQRVFGKISRDKTIQGALDLLSVKPPS